MSAVLDKILTNPGTGQSANPDYLTELVEDAIETPEVERLPFELLEHRRFQLVMRMTAQRFAALDHAERRNYRRWAEHFERVFAEKARLFRRNTKPDPDTPEFLKEKTT